VLSDNPQLCCPLSRQELAELVNAQVRHRLDTAVTSYRDELVRVHVMSQIKLASLVMATLARQP
jgi:hypothetical protein